MLDLLLIQFDAIYTWYILFMIFFYYKQKNSHLSYKYWGDIFNLIIKDINLIRIQKLISKRGLRCKI